MVAFILAATIAFMSSVGTGVWVGAVVGVGVDFGVAVGTGSNGTAVGGADPVHAVRVIRCLDSDRRVSVQRRMSGSSATGWMFSCARIALLNRVRTAGSFAIPYSGLAPGLSPE